MIGMRTILDVADNSGARRLSCILPRGGDLVVAQHVPVLDGSILGWLKVMDELAQMQPKRILPGHGPIIDNLQDALAQQRRYLERLTRDVRTLISRGAPISAAARSAGEGREGSVESF